MKVLNFILMLTIAAGQAFADSAIDWTDNYNKLLQKYVVVSSNNSTIVTAVNYSGLRQSRECEPLAAQLSQLDNIAQLSQNDQLAFWINVYNFLAIKKVVDNPGINKLTDLNKGFTSVWKQYAGTVAGNKYSLDNIEHGIIRKKFKEPRIHFAVVCVAKSCPNIRNEAYYGSRLNQQLSEQAKQFLANEQKGMKTVGNRLYISSIFFWFKKDFNNNPKEWLYRNKYIKEEIKDSYRLKRLEYDWTLNSAEK